MRKMFKYWTLIKLAYKGLGYYRSHKKKKKLKKQRLRKSKII
jgi:hypothetical protein